MKKPKIYIFESKYPKRINFTTGVRKLLVDLNIEGRLGPLSTRYAYNDSDHVSWVLSFGDSKEARNRVREVRDILHSIEYHKQHLFNVSGNGYGTGLLFRLNVNKFYG